MNTDIAALERHVGRMSRPLYVINGTPVRYRSHTVNIWGRDSDGGAASALFDPASIEVELVLPSGAVRRWAAPTYSARNELVMRRTGRGCFVMTGMEALV